jgi:hypothetical protein
MWVPFYLAGEMIRSHIKGSRALLITNDRIAPLHLERYEKLLKKGGDIQIGKCYNIMCL